MSAGVNIKFESDELTEDDLKNVLEPIDFNNSSWKEYKRVKREYLKLKNKSNEKKKD